jgi:hypothetical protein
MGGVDPAATQRFVARCDSKEPGSGKVADSISGAEFYAPPDARKGVLAVPTAARTSDLPVPPPGEVRIVSAADQYNAAEVVEGWRIRDAQQAANS